jgi:hypothetical protein
MKLVNFYYYFALFTLIACQPIEENEPELLLSQIDGEAYLATMQGEMTVQKALLLIQQDMADSLTQPDFMLLAQELANEDTVIRTHCYYALSESYMYIIPANYPILEGMIFAKLVRYPKETIAQIIQAVPDVHNLWMEFLQEEYKRQTASAEVTNVSVVNLLLKNCIDCTHEEQEDIVAFVDYITIYSANF